MKVVLVTLVDVTAGALAPLPAQAENSAKEQAKIRKVSFDYASCVVRKHHAKASEAILATASNKAILGQFTQIIDSGCLADAAGYGVNMRFPNDTYQYALADALVNADFATHGDTSIADRLPLAQPLQLTEAKQAELLTKAKGKSEQKKVQEWLAKDGARGWLLRYGECVVRQDPVSARYWLLTRPDTPEEISRIKALQPAFGGCLGEGTMKFNRVTMRGTVAVNYYRLAMATVVVGAGSSH